MLEAIEEFVKKVRSGESAFMMKVQKHFAHVISAPVGQAVCYFGRVLYADTEEEAMLSLLSETAKGHELMAIRVDDKVYLVTSNALGIYSFLRSEDLPENVFTITSVMEEAKIETEEFLFPAFLKTLTPSNKAVMLRSPLDISKSARRHLIEGTTPKYDYAFTLHTTDFLQGLANGQSVKEICESMLERQKEHYRESLGLANAIQAKMDEGTVCEPWELKLASALNCCSGKNVVVTFETNGVTASSKMGKREIEARLIEGTPFAWYNFPTEKSGKEILSKLCPGTNDHLRCSDIVRMTFNGKTIYEA